MHTFIVNPVTYEGSADVATVINTAKDDRAGRLRAFSVNVGGFVFMTTHPKTLQILGRWSDALSSIAILLQAQFQGRGATNPMLFGIDPDGILDTGQLPENVLLVTRSVCNEKVVFTLAPA